MATEKLVRQRVIECAVAMSDSGLSPGRSGNVSARFGNGFLITPSGMAYNALGVEDIVFVDEDGEWEQGEGLPSSEWRFHHDVYRNHVTTGGIVHCHSRHATVLSCCNLEIPAFHYMVAAAGGRKIPVAPYALFGTQQLSDHVVAALEGYKAALMEHHGLIALGDNVESALELAHEIEDLAAQYVLVRTLGSDKVLSLDQMDEVIERFKTYGKRDGI